MDGSPVAIFLVDTPIGPFANLVVTIRQENDFVAIDNAVTVSFIYIDLSALEPDVTAVPKTLPIAGANYFRPQVMPIGRAVNPGPLTGRALMMRDLLMTGDLLALMTIRPVMLRRSADSKKTQCYK
jgi:hypothetical protein